MEQYYISYKTDSIFMKKDSKFYRMLLEISDKKMYTWVEWHELDLSQITEIHKSNIAFEVSEKLNLLIEEYRKAKNLLKDNSQDYSLEEMNKVSNRCITYKACIIANLYILHKVCGIPIEDFQKSFHNEIIDTLKLLLKSEKITNAIEMRDLICSNILALEVKLAQLKCNCDLVKSKYKSKKLHHILEEVEPLLKEYVNKNNIEYLKKLV